MGTSSGLSRRGRHLVLAERFYIEVQLRQGAKVREIAEALGRPRETIYREIARGKCIQKSQNDFEEYSYVYLSDYSQLQADRKQSRKGRELKIGHDHELAARIEELILEQHHSPNATMAAIRKSGFPRERLISPRTLYSYIKAGVLNVTVEDLPMRGKRRVKKANGDYRHSQPNLTGRSIEQRPRSVWKREEFGHWEGDLIVGKQGTRAVVLTLVERRTRKLIACKLPNRKRRSVESAFDDLEREWGMRFKDVFKSVTFDNGCEFEGHEVLERSCLEEGAQRTFIYYAHPYCSSERGTNECCNGFLRRRIPKSCDIGQYSRKYVEESVAWVNSYPRAKLMAQYGADEYLTADEAFEIELAALL